MKNFSPLLFTTLLISLCSCKKNELGGTCRISGKVQHHSKAIAGARVFVKFDAKEFPGEDTSLYDARVLCDVNGAYEIKTYKGEYYLFARGTDPAIPSPSIVIGGAPVKIRKNEELAITLAVTEGD